MRSRGIWRIIWPLTESGNPHILSGALIESLAGLPTDPSAAINDQDPKGGGGGPRPDPRNAQMWFRDTAPAATPAERRDALLIRTWIEGQLTGLRQAVSPGTRGTMASPRQPPHEITAYGAASSPPHISEVPVGGCLLDDLISIISLPRDTAGFLLSPVLDHQESLLTKAHEELSFQVIDESAQAVHRLPLYSSLSKKVYTP